jgi:hypothetical protein
LDELKEKEKDIRQVSWKEDVLGLSWATWKGSGWEQQKESLWAIYWVHMSGFE